MPTAGFKSITVKEHIYDEFLGVWLANKEEYAMKGVSSFAGYITHLLEEMVKKTEAIEKYGHYFEKIAVEDGRIILKDNIIERIIEVKRGKELECLHCSRKNCQHVGFCWSFHEIYG